MSDRCVALTFDDGPGPSTGPLLDVLDRHQVQATFFLVGKNLRGFALGNAAEARALAIRQVRSGHQLGNHGDSHSRDPMPLPDFLHEIRTVDTLLLDIYAEAGAHPPDALPIRLPYGPPVRPRGRQHERTAALTPAGKRPTTWTSSLSAY